MLSPMCYNTNEKEMFMNYSIEDEMESDLWELEQLMTTTPVANHTPVKEKAKAAKSVVANHTTALEKEPPVVEKTVFEKAENPVPDKRSTDTFNKCKPYYGTKDQIHKALCRLYTLINGEPEVSEKLGRVRDFYLLSLAFVTVGGALTSLDSGMILVLQGYGKKAGKLGVTTDIEAWKKAFHEIDERVAAGETIEGLGRKVLMTP